MTKDKYTCIVVDDDDFSRELIVGHVGRTENLQLKKSFANAIDASNHLKSNHIDIIFLDIRMPEMSGMDFIKILENEYEVILISTADEYAIEAFERNVTDYIIKPVEYARFLKSVNKAIKNLESKIVDRDSVKEFYVRSDSKLIRVPVEGILFIEAMSDYVIIQTLEKRHIVHFTMKGIESRLPSDLFIRIHRSYIINSAAIELLEDNSVLINGKMLPIGASYKENLFNRLNLL